MQYSTEGVLNLLLTQINYYLQVIIALLKQHGWLLLVWFCICFVSLLEWAQCLGLLIQKFIHYGQGVLEIRWQLQQIGHWICLFLWHFLPWQKLLPSRLVNIIDITLKAILNCFRILCTYWGRVKKGKIFKGGYYTRNYGIQHDQMISKMVYRARGIFKQ